MLCGLAVAGEPAAATPEDLPAGLAAIRLRQRASSRPATPDLLAAVWKCPKCSALSPARRLLPEQPPFDRLAEVREMLLRVGLGQGGGWPAPAPGTCLTCGAEPPAKPEFLEVILFRYLPETGCDAVARMPVAAGKAGEVSWARLDVSGAYDTVGVLVSQEHFLAAFGRVLSVRETWADAAGQSIAKRTPVVAKVGAGYFVCCRKTGADALEEDRLAAEMGILLGRQGSSDLRAARKIRLTASDDVGLARLIPTYRIWLPGQWRQLAEGRYLAEAVIDPAGLRRLAEREMAPIGVSVDDMGLRSGDYGMPLDWGEVTVRTVHAGLSFGEGLRQFVWPEARRLQDAARIGDRIRALLSKLEVSVEPGLLLVVRAKPAAGSPAGSGAELARLSLAALAGEVDPAAPGAVEELLSGLLGFDPVTGELRPPKATDTRCSCGREAWLARKPKPAGYFDALKADVARVEWRGLDLAWSLDCPLHSRYLPATGKPPEKELEARYAKDVEAATFQIVAAKGVALDKVQARLAAGPGLAAVMPDARLRRGLVRRLKADLPGRDVLFWAPTTNIVVVSQQMIPAPARSEFRRALLEMARDAGLAPGDDLDLEIRDRLEAEPAGNFSVPQNAPPAVRK